MWQQRDSNPQFVNEQTLKQKMTSLAKWLMFVYELSDCGFEPVADT